MLRLVCLTSTGAFSLAERPSPGARPYCGSPYACMTFVRPVVLRMLRQPRPWCSHFPRSTRTCSSAPGRCTRGCQRRQQAVTRCCARSADDWGGWACAADVLIIDATNVACIAAAECRALHAVGATLHSQFTRWLNFLRLAVRAPDAIAVFDAGRVRALSTCLRKGSVWPAVLPWYSSYGL